MAKITKNGLKKDIKEIKDLIKAFKVVEHDLNETDLKISLMNIIYRKALKLINKAIEYLNERNDLSEGFMKDIIKYEDNINKYVTVLSVEIAYSYIIGYLNL